MKLLFRASSTSRSQRRIERKTQKSASLDRDSFELVAPSLNKSSRRNKSRKGQNPSAKATTEDSSGVDTYRPLNYFASQGVSGSGDSETRSDLPLLRVSLGELQETSEEGALWGNGKGLCCVVS